jgi:hypothetical protein
MLTLTIYISFTIIIIALIAGVTIYFRRNSELYLRLFPFYMLLTVVVGGYITYLSFHGKDNTTLFNFYTTVGFCFYFFVIAQIIHNRKIKKIIFYILFIYPIVAVCNIFIVQKINILLSVSYSLGCLLIAVFCVYYFLELFQLTNSINLLRQPSFWICSGLLFYYSCSFPLFGLIGFLKSPPKIIANNLEIISNILDCCLYSSFTIAFLCRIKIRKSIL